MIVLLRFALIAAIIFLVVWLIVRPFLKQGRRHRIAAQKFPEPWWAILQSGFPLFRSLPGRMRNRLEQHLQIFLAEKSFEPCGGLDEVTEKMRVLIGAQACLLLIGLKRHSFYPKLKSILVYPTAFRDRGHRRFGLTEEDHASGRGIRLGESWTTGSVVLAWDSVQRGAANADDGMNVVLHEFAHQLDQADGSADGAPILSDSSEYRDWAEVMRRDYDELVDDANDPRADPLLDTYGAEDPAEFFAVATETFFEKPRQLREAHPQLYRELKDYYGLDPAEWKRPERC